MSIPMNFRKRLAAATTVVPDPKNGSKTKSSGFVNSLMNKQEGLAEMLRCEICCHTRLRGEEHWSDMPFLVQSNYQSSYRTAVNF